MLGKSLSVFAPALTLRSGRYERVPRDHKKRGLLLEFVNVRSPSSSS